MRRIYLVIFILISFISGNSLYADSPVIKGLSSSETIWRDTLNENQALYNGRIWRNLYYTVNGNQFLFSNEFLTGSLSIKGKSFTNVPVKYDAFKDELLTPIDHGRVLQLNKELVDSFTIYYQNKAYHFIRIREDSIGSPTGYLCVLYNGKTELYFKYIKKINKLSISGESDTFYQSEKLYFVRNNQFISVSGKADLLKAMGDKRDLIKAYIRKNNISVSAAEPESIVPVIRYFDSLSQ